MQTPVAGIALTVLVLALTGCGEGGDDSAERSAVPTDGAGSTASTSGAGSATLEIDGETYTFDRVLCAFGSEETQRDDTEFVLSAIQDGMQLDATIDTRFGHVVSLDDIEDFENPRVAWSAGDLGSATAGSEEIIHVDGKHVEVEATFTDQTTGTNADGTLDAVCP